MHASTILTLPILLLSGALLAVHAQSFVPSPSVPRNITSKDGYTNPGPTQPNNGTDATSTGINTSIGTSTSVASSSSSSSTSTTEAIPSSAPSTPPLSPTLPALPPRQFYPIPVRSAGRNIERGVTVLNVDDGRFARIEEIYEISKRLGHLTYVLSRASADIYRDWPDQRNDKICRSRAECQPVMDQLQEFIYDMFTPNTASSPPAGILHLLRANDGYFRDPRVVWTGRMFRAQIQSAVEAADDYLSVIRSRFASRDDEVAITQAISSMRGQWEQIRDRMDASAP